MPECVHAIRMIVDHDEEITVAEMREALERALCGSTIIERPRRFADPPSQRMTKASAVIDSIEFD